MITLLGWLTALVLARYIIGAMWFALVVCYLEVMHGKPRRDVPALFLQLTWSRLFGIDRYVSEIGYKTARFEPPFKIRFYKKGQC